MSQQIIEWSIDGIRVLSADASGRVDQAGIWESFEHHDTSFTPQELGEKLRKWVKSTGITPGPMTLLLPRETVVVRQIQLPNAPEEEIPDLVKFQSAAKSSMPIDDLALDYLRIHSARGETGLSVLTVSIDRKRLQRIIQILTAAGFEVAHVTMTPLSVGQYVKAFAGATLGMKQPEMVVFQRNSLVELSIFDRGELVFSHSMVLPEANRLKPLESGLTRSLVALHQTHPDVSVDRCFVVGASQDQAVRELLQKKFHGNLVEVSLPVTLAGATSTNGYEPLIGGALPVANPELKIDLLHPRRRIDKPNRKKLYWIGGSAAAVLFLVLSYGLFLSKKGGLEASIEVLNDTISVADRKLKEGQPQVDAFLRIESWSQGEVHPISAWNQLRNQMPGTQRLYLSELRLQPVNVPEVEARFTGVGFARQRNDVDNLYQKLAENGFRVTPQATANTSRDPDYPVRFELNVELLRKKTPPPEKPKSVAKGMESETENRS